jgi:hypothetical protein
MASSISNHSQQSHLHASSMTVDLASSPMSFSTDVGSAVLGTCLQAKSLGFDASHCQHALDRAIILSRITCSSFRAPGGRRSVAAARA